MTQSDSRLAAARMALSQGRPADGVKLLIAALNDDIPATPEILRALVVNLIKLGRYAEALPWAEKAVERQPRDYQLLNYLGIIFRRTHRYADAISAFDRAIRIKPNDPQAQINKGNVYNDQKNGAAAEAVFTKLVRRDPRNAELQRQLGRALWWQHKSDAAALRMRQATMLDSNNADSWLDLSAIMADGGTLEAALAVLDTALTYLPDHERILRARLVLLHHLGRQNEAEQFLRGLSHRFESAGWFHHEFARILAETDYAAANARHRRAVELSPDDLAFAAAYAESLDRTRIGDEAANIEQAYQVLKHALARRKPKGDQTKAILEIFTRSADFETTEQLGDFDQICQYFEDMRQVPPLGLMARVKTAADRKKLLQAHRVWGNHLVDRARRNPIVHSSAPRSGSKIRLGFMSSDLRSHPVAYFSWPLFEFADRDRFEIYCYSWYRGEEGRAQKALASMVDCFRWHPFISDHDAAQLIADDQLDILFELGGTTHMNKLDVMAWKPAQLTASWLGYPHSSGLGNIDYILVDPFLNPPDESLLLERPMVMPKSWIAMSERAFPDIHEIDPILPVKRNGFISFGTANNPYKYNAAMIATWARVLAAVPGSRFVFVRPEGGSPTFVQNIRAHFKAEGIASDRIEFRAVRGTHMAHYNAIDIALDTFPQTGGTTTCEAAWMGVPTVSLVGEALFERLSYSILQNAGLGDLCAASREEYVEKAMELAADVDRLQMLRTGLRDQLRASPLGQTRKFAEDFYNLVAATVNNQPSPAR